MHVHVLSPLIKNCISVSLLLSPATLTRSTGKPDDFTSSKRCASMYNTAANVDWEVELEYSRNDQDMRMDEAMSSTVDGARIGNEYYTPSSIAATAFTGEAGTAFTGEAATAFTGEAVYATNEPVNANIQ